MKLTSHLCIATLLLVAAACAERDSSPEQIDAVRQGLSGAARRPRSEAIRDTAAGARLTNGVLLAGIAQVETGMSHCWSEATWACKGPNSPSCGGGPVIAGASDGPCSAQQGGLGMFQFDGGTFSQTLARDGEEVLLLEGNISHAVDFVAERVRQDIPGVSSRDDAIDWMNGLTVRAGDPKFEQWIAMVSCRYNGCCGCSRQEAKYRNATLDVFGEFEPGFWGDIAEPPVCEPVPEVGAVLDEDDACAQAGGPLQYWRTETAGYSDKLMWTHATDSADAANFGQWNLTFVAAGRYRLDIFTDGGTFAQSRSAAYKIRHAGGEATVTIDQSASNGWQSLGDFDFGGATSYSVFLGDNTGEPLANNTRIAFDALRITPVSATDPGEDPTDPGTDPRADPGDGPSDDPHGGNPATPSEDDDLVGGCNSGGSQDSTGGLILVLGIALCWRRRNWA